MSSKIALIAGLMLAAVFLVILLWPSTVNRAENERIASNVLSRLSAVEAYYRANDRDGNGINDYWTPDVAGLYPEPEDILDRGIAEADAGPLHPLVPKPIPYYGYYFIALRQDESVSPPEDYAQDTDKKSGKVHHLSKFAFCAFPAEMGLTGRYIYIVNQNSTQYRMASPPSQELARLEGLVVLVKVRWLTLLRLTSCSDANGTGGSPQEKGPVVAWDPKKTLPTGGWALVRVP